MPGRSRFDSAPLQTPINVSEARWRLWFQNMWAAVMAIGLPRPSAITVSASPFLYQFLNAGTGSVIVLGGTVSKIEFSRDNTTFYDCGVTSGMLTVSQEDYLRVTYTVAPTMTLILR